MVRPGDAVAGRYLVIARIAEGGMGVLWRARHTELDVEVALKVMSSRAQTQGALKRFKREAQAVARLRSPHIVQVLDYGVFEDEPYLVMELLRGEDLATLLSREGPLSVARCETILGGVAKALQFAHDAGIVHRDLKPANIFLERIGEDEVVKVLDFGVARDLHEAPDPASTTQMGGLGSPAYMSPEQVWGAETQRPADIWAMGVVAFEMLTGKNPFVDQTQAKIFERIVRDELPRLTSYDGELPASLDGFFDHALARSPKERIGSAAEFLSQFREAAASPLSEASAELTNNPAKLRDPASSRVAITERKRRRSRAGAVPMSRGVRFALVAVVFGLLAVAAFLLGEPKTRVEPQQVLSEAQQSGSERMPLPEGSEERSPTPASTEQGERSPIAPDTAAARATASATKRAQPKPLPARMHEPEPTPPSSAAPPARTLDPRFGIPVGR